MSTEAARPAARQDLIGSVEDAFGAELLMPSHPLYSDPGIPVLAEDMAWLVPAPASPPASDRPPPPTARGRAGKEGADLFDGEPSCPRA